MNSLQCLACWSSHWQLTSPDFLKELKHLSIWCQIHSDKSWSCLVLHALGSNLGLGCFQNQCCTALLSNKVLHTKEKREIFLARQKRMHLLSIQLEKQIFKEKKTHLSILCQLHISTFLHDLDLSTQIWLRQALCSQIALIYWDVSKRPTTSSCKMKKPRQKAALQGSVDLLCSRCSLLK